MILFTQETSLTFGPSTQLEAINTTRDKDVLQVQMEHKVKTMKVLERHKIHLEAVAQMNIPLCCMISMPIVQLAFKIDVLKMEHVFQTSYREGNKVFNVSPTNQKGEEEFVAYHIHKWDVHQKVVNASFEEALDMDVNMQRFTRRMFFVWDNNHQIQAWMPYISRVQLDDMFWHIVIDSIMLDMKEGLVWLLIAMINLNK